MCNGNPQVPSANVHRWRNLAQVPNSNGGLFVLTIHPLGGEALQQRHICLSKNHIFRHAKKTCFATHTGLISLGVSDTSSKAIWVGHVPPTPYLFNWHRKTQLTPSHPRKMPKLHPQAVSHTLSGVMKVSPNGMTSQPPTPLLWNWTFFSRHFGNTLVLKWDGRIFLVILTDLTGHGSRWWCHCQRNPRSQVSPKKTSDFKLFGTQDCSDFCSLFEVTWCWSSCRRLQGELTTFKMRHSWHPMKSWLLHKTPSNGLHNCNPKKTG